MRLGTALFALLLLPLVVVPPAHADLASAATYAATAPCVAGGAYEAGVGIGVPGCAVSASGTVTATSCDATSCVLAIDARESGAGLLPGLQTAAIKAGAAVCGAQDVSLDGTFACDGAATLTFAIPSGCRFLVLESSLVSDVKLAGADVTNVFRVCTSGAAGTVEQVQ
jgi:hypothetical protein